MIWAALQVSPGEKEEALVPVVMSFWTAQVTAS